MDELFTIRVQIVDRTYPLKIRREEEENIRRAVKKINSTIAEYRELYKSYEVQDFLAMTLIQYATHITENEENQKALPVIEEMQRTDNLLAELLKNE